jgi:putative phosphoesterase
LAGVRRHRSEAGRLLDDRAAGSMRAVVLSDTHMRAGGRRRLPDAVYQVLDGADVILHAGDLVDESVLAALQSIAPTYAVLGNNDLALEGSLPISRDLELGGVRVAMVHDSGARQGRAARMARRFPGASVVVFGHSHIPWNETGVGGQLLFNPGSPTERRTQPHLTAGILRLEGGAVLDHRIVNVDAMAPAG